MKSNKEAIYLDTTVIIAYAWNIIKRKKEKNVLERLSEKYILVTSLITKFECINYLIKKMGFSLSKARNLFNEIINKFKISMVSPENIKITYNFIEEILKAGVSFRDGLHVIIARKLKLACITGNKNHIPNMRKLYSEVYTAKDVLKKN